MVSDGYDEGPRIDLGHEPEDPGYDLPETGAPTAGHPSPAPPAGGRGLALAGLVLALLALALGVFALTRQPEPQPLPPIASETVPGGTGERVAKLEKDVYQLILRMVSLEKQLQAVAGKSGSITKLTELNAKVAALQDRLDALALEKRMADLGKRQPPAPADKPQVKPAPRVKQKPKPKPPARKKLVYTVRRGDTLFTVAQRYKVRMSQLMKWNNIKRGHVLKVGEKLVIYK